MHCTGSVCSPLIRKFFVLLFRRFGKRVPPAPAPARFGNGYYGDDADDENELLEELLAEAGLE